MMAGDQSTGLFVCFCLFVYLFICLFVYLFIYLFVSLFLCLFVFLYFCCFCLFGVALFSWLFLLMEKKKKMKCTNFVE